MRSLLTSPLGLLIGLSLGALGGGGSVLAVPALVYAAGEGPRGATATSLLVVGLSALLGAVAHWRRGRVRVGPGLLFGLAGVGGSLVGSRLNSAVDPQVLLLAFSGLMLVAAWRMAVGRPTASPRLAVVPEPPAGDHHPALPAGSPLAASVAGGPRPTATLTLVPSGAATETAGPGSGLASAPVPRSPGRRHWRVDPGLVAAIAVAGTAVGFLTGFFGVGGGFVIVPALVLALRFEMPVAVGTSLLVIAVNSAVGILARLHSSGVDWHVAVPFTLLALVGSFVGERVAGRLRGDVLTRWFVALLVLVAGYTAARAALAL